MEVPDEDTTAGQLLSSKSSVGRKNYESASAGAETTATDTAAAEAAEGPAQADAEAAKPSASNGPGTAAAAGDKKIPPGAVRMLSMTTVAEFQKKVAERKGRMPKDE